jgi:hypothetical protein
MPKNDEDDDYKDDDGWQSGEEELHEFASTFADRGRAGLARVEGGTRINARNKEEANLFEKLNRQGNESDKFKDALELAKVKLEEFIDFTQEEMDSIYEKIEFVNKPENKNPVCFLLGYKGKSLEVTKVNRLIDIVTKNSDFFDEYGIRPADVVRYSRFANGVY